MGQNALTGKYDKVWQQMKAAKLPRNLSLSMLVAAQQVECLGMQGMTCIEFGVATGTGLRRISNIANFIQRHTGVKMKIYGFDLKTGLPNPQGAVDHPEIWANGQFKMHNFEQLQKELPGNCQLIIGDIAQTLKDFSPLSNYPIGFVSVDVDLYSSTHHCLGLFEDMSPTAFVPAVTMYFDDVENLVTMNSACGEALAIEEFNSRNYRRIVIDQNPILRGKFHTCHLLEHPARTGEADPVHRFEINWRAYT